MYSLSARLGNPRCNLRAVCQGAIPGVASRGIWERSLASKWIPVPAILHRQLPCLLCHFFLTQDYSGITLIRGGWFRLRLTINCLGWHTISYHYTFKLETFFCTKNIGFSLLFWRKSSHTIFRNSYLLNDIFSCKKSKHRLYSVVESLVVDTLVSVWTRTRLT
jgi:hypothetical protein